MDEYSALWRPGTETASSRTAPLAPSRAPAREFFLAKALSFGAKGSREAQQQAQGARSKGLASET